MKHFDGLIDHKRQPSRRDAQLDSEPQGLDRVKLDTLTMSAQFSARGGSLSHHTTVHSPSFDACGIIFHEVFGS